MPRKSRKNKRKNKKTRKNKGGELVQNPQVQMQQLENQQLQKPITKNPLLQSVKNIPGVAPVNNIPGVAPVNNIPGVAPVNNIPGVAPVNTNQLGVGPVKNTPGVGPVNTNQLGVAPVNNIPGVAPVNNTPGVAPVNNIPGILQPQVTKITLEKRPVIKKGIPKQLQNSQCENASTKCNFSDTQYTGKLNQTWKTCINMNGIYNHILYLTPNNVVIKSIETIQIPEFVVKCIDKTGNGAPMSSKIMIEDKYITAFLYICGDWYAIMRLFGKTLNTQYLARTEKNRAFFKLSNISVDIDTKNPETNRTSVINIQYGSYKLVNETKLAATSNVPTVNIRKGFVNIDKNSVVRNKRVFNVLQRFRQQKLLAHNAKEELAENVASDILGFGDYDPISVGFFV
jgi:hypothetical protein